MWERDGREKGVGDWEGKKGRFGKAFWEWVSGVGIEELSWKEKKSKKQVSGIRIEGVFVSPISFYFVRY